MMSRFNRGKLLPCFYHINTGLVSAVLLLSLNLCAQAAVINNPPTATSATIIGKEDTKTSITLKGKDLEKKKLTYAIVNQPTYGTVTLVGSKATYTPSANYFNTASTPDRFTFKTNDGLLDSVPATVDIVVKAVNDVPVVQKGIATTLQDTKVDITLMGSDVEGDPLTYVPSKSKKGGTVAVKSGNTVTFTPKKGYVGADSFTFTAKDSNKGISKAATVSITVSAKPPNVSPTANAGADQAVNEKMSVTLDGSGSKDSDGSIVSYRWMQRKQPLGIVATLSGANTAKPTFTAPELVGDTLASATLAFDLTVTDNNGAMATDTVVVVINNVATNIPPGANAGNDKEANENTQVTLDGTGSTDSDGNLVKYEWKQTAGSPTVTLTGADTAKPTFTAPDVTADTTLTFELTVTDNQNATAKDTVNVQVKKVVANVPPVADAGEDQTVDKKTTVILDGSGSADSDGTIASYYWEQTDGTMVALFRSDVYGRELTFVTPDVSADETLTFKLTVTDDKGLRSEDAVDIFVQHNMMGLGVAYAGENQIVAEGLPVFLGNRTRNQTNIKSILWRQVAGQSVVLSSIDTLNPFFIAPDVDAYTRNELSVQADASNKLIFEQIVTDYDGVTDIDTVTIHVADNKIISPEIPYTCGYNMERSKWVKDSRWELDYGNPGGHDVVYKRLKYSDSLKRRYYDEVEIIKGYDGSLYVNCKSTEYYGADKGEGEEEWKHEINLKWHPNGNRSYVTTSYHEYLLPRQSEGDASRDEKSFVWDENGMPLRSHHKVYYPTIVDGVMDTESFDVYYWMNSDLIRSMNSVVDREGDDSTNPGKTKVAYNWYESGKMRSMGYESSTTDLGRFWCENGTLASDWRYDGEWDFEHGYMIYRSYKGEQWWCNGQRREIWTGEDTGDLQIREGSFFQCDGFIAIKWIGSSERMVTTWYKRNGDSPNIDTCTATPRYSCSAPRTPDHCDVDPDME
jgi:hypothetical protein